MRYRLRTLLIVLAIGPLLIWLPVKIHREHQAFLRSKCQNGLHGGGARHNPQEPRPMRFTIRDLLWLMVVVALTAGWIDQYRRRAAVDNHAFRLKLALQLARDYAKQDGHPLPDGVWWELADAPIP